MRSTGIFVGKCGLYAVLKLTEKVMIYCTACMAQTPTGLVELFYSCAKCQYLFTFKYNVYYIDNWFYMTSICAVTNAAAFIILWGSFLFI